MPFSFGNILSGLANFDRGLNAPGGNMPWARPAPLAVDPQGEAIPSIERLLAPARGEPIPSVENYLANLNAPSSPTAAVTDTAQPPAAPVQQADDMPRKRRSLIDTIGRLSDVFANVGGAPAQYQPYLDAREDRELALGDHARQVDLDALKKQQLEQQIKTGDLSFQGDERARLGQALGAVAENPDAASMWPQIAEQAGITPEKAAQVGVLLQQNPGSAAVIAESLGWAPVKQGSQAKELQVYSLLRQESPELADTYLQSIARPGSLTPYQEAQLKIAGERLDFDQYKFANPQPTAAERNGNNGKGGPSATLAGIETVKPIFGQIRQAIEDLNDAGGMNAPGSSIAGRAGVWAQQNLPGVQQVLNPDAFSASERINSLATNAMLTIAPILNSLNGVQIGAKMMDAAKEQENMKNAIVNAKDYKSAIAAVNDAERRVNDIQKYYQQQQGGNRPNNAPPPRTNRQPPKAAPKAAPKPAAVRKPVPNAAALAEAKRRGLI